jgi:hypothetical protein
MRIFAALAASTHICLAACQTSPEALLPPPGGASPLAIPAATPSPASTPTTPYMRCVNDFWGNCTGVASNRHDYRWRYVKPGARPRDLRESAKARESIAAARTPAAVREPAPPRDKAASPKEKAASPKEKAVPPREKAAAAKEVTGNQNIPMREKAVLRERPGREAAVTIRDTTAECHARRRVVGDERPSSDDARRAAENGWMGAVRYDHGERYQDINRAKDVRHVCGPSSISIVLKTPHFRCVVEATPCRATQGTPTEPDERRYDPPIREDQISRK